MSRRTIGTSAPGGLYSKAVVVGELVFVTGQTAREERGIEAQTREVLRRLGAILKDAGTDYANVARCGVYLKDVADFAKMNEVYREFFTSDCPARTTIQAELAYPEILVEIDCVAAIPKA